MTALGAVVRFSVALVFVFYIQGGSQDALRVVRMIAGIFRMREGRLRLIERNTRFQDRRGQAHSRTKEVR